MKPCYRCARPVPEDVHDRRAVMVGRRADGRPNYRAVRLCPTCLSAHDRQERNRQLLDASMIMLIVSCLTAGTLFFFNF